MGFGLWMDGEFIIANAHMPTQNDQKDHKYGRGLLLRH